MRAVKAREIMTKTVITAGVDMRLTEVMEQLLRWHISGMPVVDDENRLIGIITEYDLVNLAFDGNAADTKVGDVMTREVTSFSPDTLMAVIAKTFSAQRLRRAPIVDVEGRVIGIVSRRDILRELLRCYSGVV